MRLIDADALINDRENFIVIGAGDNICIDIYDIEKAPTIEDEPVKHGRWEWDTEDIYRCTVCYEKVHVKEVMGRPDWDYCPNCGAKMDGGTE